MFWDEGIPALGYDRLRLGLRLWLSLFPERGEKRPTGVGVQGLGFEGLGSGSRI
jgi:hypothetical protein